MERLTKEALEDSYVLNPQENIPNVIVEGMIYNKLGRLEDLEQQFKCPLEIVAKLMLKEIDTIYIIYSDGGGYASIYGDLLEAYVGEMFIDGYYLDNNPYKENNYHTGWVIETNFCHIPLEDYGVYWWTKEDGSE